MSRALGLAEHNEYDAESSRAAERTCLSEYQRGKDQREADMHMRPRVAGGSTGWEDGLHVLQCPLWTRTSPGFDKRPR